MFGVLITFQRPAALSEHLDVLARQTRLVDHLIVVDNGATSSASATGPGPVEALAARPDAAAACEYLPMPENLGPAGGISHGLRRVLDIADDDDWVVLLDDDNPPRRDDLIESLLSFAVLQHAEQPELAMVGKTGGRFDLRRGRVRRLRDDELSGAVPVDYVAGGQLPLIRVGALRKVGVFDERFFFSFDDLDFGLRLRDLGYVALIEGSVAHWARARVGHLGGGARAPRRAPIGAAWRRYYSLRNLVFILRERGHRSAALRVSLQDGVLKALAIAVRRPRSGWPHIRLTAKALADGWTGRLGRRVEPTPAVESPPVTRVSDQ